MRKSTGNSGGPVEGQKAGIGSKIGAKVLNRLTENPSQIYSYGMISEFQDLSDKIDRLAALTLSLRRDNAHLRQSNARLIAENVSFMERLSQASVRVEALLAKIPAPEGDDIPNDEAAQ